MTFTVLNLHTATVQFMGTEKETLAFLRPKYPYVTRRSLKLDFSHHWVRPSAPGDQERLNRYNINLNG